MAANVNQNRYRIILLLYLVFICLSLLSVPKSLLESNLYMIRTLNFQDSLLSKQLSYLNDSANGIARSFRDLGQRGAAARRGDTLFLLQENVRAVYVYTDSIDKKLQTYLLNQNTSIEKEYAKKRSTNSFFKNDTVLEKLQQELFGLSKKMMVTDSTLGNSFSQQLPATEKVVSRTKKEYSWQKYFFVDKPASVAYMHLLRIKLLLLQAGIQLAEQRIANAWVSTRTLNSPNGRRSGVSQNINSSTADSVALPASPSVSTPELQQSEIINSIRLERFYVGVPMVLLEGSDKFNLRDLEVSITPSVRLITGPEKLSALFSTPGQYQLQVFLKTASGKKPIMQRKINADRLPDPVVRVSLEGNTRNVIRSEDLSRVNSLVANIPISGLPPVMLRVNGFRGTIVGAGTERSSVYNYGQVFQEPMKELINSLKQGDLLLLDNITVAVGDGSTRSASSILYKIVN